VEYILTSLFVAEALIKIIAFGFLFCGSTSYIRSAWNALDLIVVIFTVSFILASHKYSWFRMF
jgi:hypothetical protein